MLLLSVEMYSTQPYPFPLVVMIETENQPQVQCKKLKKLKQQFLRNAANMKYPNHWGVTNLYYS